MVNPGLDDQCRPNTATFILPRFSTSGSLNQPVGRVPVCMTHGPRVGLSGWHGRAGGGWITADGVASLDPLRRNVTATRERERHGYSLIRNWIWNGPGNAIGVCMGFKESVYWFFSNHPFYCLWFGARQSWLYLEWARFMESRHAAYSRLPLRSGVGKYPLVTSSTGARREGLVLSGRKGSGVT